MKTRRKQQQILPILSGAIIVFTVAILGSIGVFRKLDIFVWDICARLGSGTHKPDPRVVLIAVDQPSMDYFSHQQVLWPWPRDMWARVIEIADNAGAAAILFDILYDDPGIDRLNSQAEATDKLFANRLSGELPTVLASFLTPGSKPVGKIPQGLLWNESGVEAVPMPGHTLLLPHQRFREAQMGLSNVMSDKDGVLRATPLLYENSGFLLPSLSLKTASLIDNSIIDRVNLDSDGRYWIRYYGEGGPGGAFNYISAHDMILGRIHPDTLKGKILIAGGYAAGLLDYKSTPVSDPRHPFPGFEIHATIVSNLLQGDGFVMTSRLVGFFLIVIFGFSGLIIVRVFKTIVKQGVAFLIFTVLAIILLLFLHNTGILLPIASPTFAAYFGIGAMQYVGWQVEGRQRTKLHGLFSRYLDDSVIDDMMERPDELQMVGIKRRATILFTDMVGFTPLSEQLTPEATVTVLNEYHTVVVDAILKNRGLLDKYVGDAVMAIFGAPVPYPESPLMAARAILDIQEAVNNLTAQRTENGKPTVGLRIGVHTDDVIIGNIGHPKRMDYTAIGSGVNIASRLEGATRLLGADNLVSEPLFSELQASIRGRELGRVILKGLHEPLRVFELISDEQAGEWLEAWSEAWEFWHSGSRSKAILTWQTIAEILTEDKALNVLITRMLKFEKNNGADDDVFKLFSK